MEYEYNGRVLKLSKELSELDRLVLSFTGMLSASKIRYVIVSGYVAILFGRSRTTEDVDLFVDSADAGKIPAFLSKAARGGYWIVDSESAADAMDRLGRSLSIRVARRDTAVPNFEVKFAKKNTDFRSLNDPLEVVVNGKVLLVSPLEVQIPFKISLGSDKDIEDAVHIYEVFKDRLDRRAMADAARRLKVKDKMRRYGIV